MKKKSAFSTLGQSGAKVVLIPGSTHERASIQKSFNNATYEGQQKLVRSMVKQKEAASEDKFYPFKVPKVLTWDESIPSFTMEVVPGIPLGEFLNQARSQDLEIIGGKLSEYLSVKEEIRAPNISLAKRKIDELVDVLSRDWTWNNLVDLGEVRTVMNANLDRLPAIPRTNHGDFSMDNILVRVETLDVFLIDFHEGPLDSKGEDFGRIWLDLKFGWWNKGPDVHIEYWSRGILSDAVLLAAKSVGISSEMLDSLSLLSALRVAPYTKNPNRKALLIFAVQNLLRKVQSGT